MYISRWFHLTAVAPVLRKFRSYFADKYVEILKSISTAARFVKDRRALSNFPNFDLLTVLTER